MGTNRHQGSAISSVDTPFPASTSTLEMACRRLKWEQPDRQCANGDAQTKYDMPKQARPIFHFRRIGRPCLLERRVLTRCEPCPFPASTPPNPFHQGSGTRRASGLRRQILTALDHRQQWATRLEHQWASGLGHQAGTWATEANPDSTRPQAAMGNKARAPMGIRARAAGGHLGCGGKS